MNTPDQQPDSHPAGDRRRSLLRLIGYLLLAGLAIWIVTDLITFRSTGGSIPPLIGDNHQFVGNSELRAEVIAANFEKGRAQMVTSFRRGNRFAAGARFADWAAFGITAAITLLAGYLGMPVPAAMDQNQPPAIPANDSKNKRVRRFATLVGSLAALASIATATSGKLASTSKDWSERGDKIRLAIANFEKEVKEADSAGAARRVLDDFNAQLLRLE
jgi:hypothetical protein